MILLSLLAGCHVFEVVAIDCASDEPCARPAKDRATDTDTAVDTDTDTDSGTDTDTGPVVRPTVGWVVSGSSGGGNRVVAFSPAGGTVAAWTDLGDAEGPVAYDPVTGNAVVAAGGQLVLLGVGGGVLRAVDGYPYVRDVATRDNIVYVAAGDNLIAYDGIAETRNVAFTTTVTGLAAVSLGPDGLVYASDTDAGAPDLYTWDGAASPAAVHTDYDTSGARAQIVFAGPDGAPHTCSSAGAVYAVASLASGSSRPVAFYSGGLTDVSACAYDPGDETWLLFSPAVGVIRLDAQSRAEVVFEPVSSYTLVRASFY